MWSFILILNLYFVDALYVEFLKLNYSNGLSLRESPATNGQLKVYLFYVLCLILQPFCTNTKPVVMEFSFSVYFSMFQSIMEDYQYEALHGNLDILAVNLELDQFDIQHQLLVYLGIDDGRE